jgi:hypothetical protein
MVAVKLILLRSPGELRHAEHKSVHEPMDCLSRVGFAFGCGVDCEYSHAWMGDADMIQPQDTLRITTGAVLRIGTW